ncbi:hypothetical protein LX81_04223 [Palleronia aestuarii]|uniref:Uncharacterized protein n=1 Tax=Palleronia aestuarii TaxID=568105 RepID=A0A2W7NBI4_9RHOB|nr:hypothetical protein [Palleronia aestuarii]PZX10386.1 hypothetical protein LX81_04223 [Palleronia aestuarii]
MLDHSPQDRASLVSRLELRGKTSDSINSATSAVLTAAAECDAEDIDCAVAAGRRAFEAGS